MLGILKVSWPARPAWWGGIRGAGPWRDLAVAGVPLRLASPDRRGETCSLVSTSANRGLAVLRLLRSALMISLPSLISMLSSLRISSAFLGSL